MRVSRVVVALLTALAAAACSRASGLAPYLTPPAIPCPAVDTLAGARTGEALPTDFQPVSAVRCTFGPAVGRSSAAPHAGLAWIAAQRSTGPFDDLVRALRLPPQKQDGELVCTADFVMPVLLALTDASGRTLVPALPGTVCRTPLPEVRSALDALTWVEIARGE